MLTLRFNGRDRGAIEGFQARRELRDGALTETWSLRLLLTGPAPAQAEAQARALEALCGVEGDLALVHDGREMRALRRASCASGPVLARCVHDAQPVAVHDRRAMTLEFLAALSPLASGVELPETGDEQLSVLTRRRVVFLPLLGPGLPDHRQDIGAPSSEVTQQGRAQSLRAFAPAPEPLFPLALIEREVRLESEGELRVTRWRYVMRLTITLAPETLA